MTRGLRISQHAGSDFHAGREARKGDDTQPVVASEPLQRWPQLLIREEQAHVEGHGRPPGELRKNDDHARSGDPGLGASDEKGRPIGRP